VIGAFDYNDELLALKIGVSGDFRDRIAALQTGQFCEMKLIVGWKSESRAKCFSVERALHDRYRAKHMRGEWFRPAVARDVVSAGIELMGSLPCEVPGVSSHLGEVRDGFERKRERRLRRKEARKRRRG